MLAMAPALWPAAGGLTNMPMRLCHDGRECGKQAKNFGSAHATVEECAEAARADPECGSAIMWSPVYGKDWGCRCCKAPPPLPVPDRRGVVSPAIFISFNNQLLPRGYRHELFVQ